MRYLGFEKTKLYSSIRIHTQEKLTDASYAEFSFLHDTIEKEVMVR